MWILFQIRFQNCEFCEKWDFRSVNFVKNVISEMWILWKIEISEMWILWKSRFQKCKFCEKCTLKMWILWKKWGFEIVNFVKNEILKMWILWKMRFSRCDLFDELCILARVLFGKISLIFQLFMQKLMFWQRLQSGSPFCYGLLGKSLFNKD